MNTAEMVNLSGGYVKIEVSGDFIERFLNMCAAKNIYIWDVSLRGEKLVRCKTSARGFKKMRSICRATHTRAHIISRYGMPFVLKRILRRKGLIAGFFVFILMTVWLCSHIWYIEIIGEEMPQEEIRALLEKSGVKYGMPVYGIDPEKIKAEILSNEPRLAWVWTEVKGTGIYVDYRKRVEKPEMLDINTPCNLIASENGRIISILIKEGRTVVQNDMYVSKGQLLAGGVMDSSAVGMRFVHSDGEVWARTQHTLSGRYLLTAEENVRTGRRKVRFGIKLGEKVYTLQEKEKFYDEAETNEEEFHFKIGNIYFPISVIKTSFYETEANIVTLNKEKIIEEAKEYLEKSLQNSAESVIILERSFIINDIDDNTIEVTMNAVCNQQIAQKQPIEEERYEDN